MTSYERYITACVHYYGVIDPDTVDDILKAHGQAHIDRTFDEERLGESFVVFHDGWFMDEAFYEEGDCGDLLRTTIGRPYHIPDRETLLAYVDPHHLEITPALKRMHALFSRQKNLSMDAWEATLEIREFLFHGSDFQEVYDRAADLGVRLNSFRKRQRFVTCMYDVKRGLRMWENRGHTYDELNAYFSIYDETTTTVMDDESQKQYEDVSEKMESLGDMLDALTDPTVDKMMEEAIVLASDKTSAIPDDDVFPAVVMAHHLTSDDDETKTVTTVMETLGCDTPLETILRHAYFLLSQVFNRSINDATIDTHDKVMALLEEHGVRGLVPVQQKYARIIQNRQAKTEVDHDLHQKIVVLLPGVREMAIDLTLHLVNLALLYPLAHETLSVLSVQDDVDQASRELLLEGTITAFEKVNADVLRDPDNDFLSTSGAGIYRNSLTAVGFMHEQRGELEDAQRAYETSLKTAADREDVIAAEEHLLSVCLKRGDWDRALNIYQDLPDGNEHKTLAKIFIDHHRGDPIGPAFREAYAMDHELVEAVCQMRHRFSEVRHDMMLTLAKYITLMRDDHELKEQATRICEALKQERLAETQGEDGE